MRYNRVGGRPTALWVWVTLLSALTAMTGIAQTEEPARSYFDAAKGTAWWAVDNLMDKAGYGGCPFRDAPVKAAKQALEEGIRAQPLAIESLVEALSAWDYDQRTGRHAPLVVALTGSTGTGKTQTAEVLAEAMLERRCRITGATRDIPTGLLKFNGEDYMYPSKVEEYQRKIRRKLGKRLEFCYGNVVVLFDELQKVAPGTLNALTEAMSEHPRLTYEDAGGRDVSVDTSRVVFLLVTDVGAEGINKIVQAFKQRSDVTPMLLQSAVKKALDEQWERLRFGKMVSMVIPYLPMDAESNLLVLELKLREVAETLDGGLYTTHGLRWHLVSPKYISYKRYGEEMIVHNYANYGARDVVKRSINPVKAVIRNHVQSPTCSATEEAAAAAEQQVCGRGGEGKGGRCWSEPFMLDIRYDTTTDKVSFHRCAPEYAEGLTELQREQPSVVESPMCDLAWRGVLHDPKALA